MPGADDVHGGSVVGFPGPVRDGEGGAVHLECARVESRLVAEQSEQRIVAAIAKALKISEAEAKQSFSVIPTHGTYPWVPEAAYAEIREALKSSDISVEMKNRSLYFKYPTHASVYCLSK